MNETNIDVMCRLCLNNSFLHYNIFAGESTDSKPTYEIINYAYDLQISADDGLPEYICENCFAIVKTFKVYKTNAHKARSEIIRLKEKVDKNPTTEVANNEESCNKADTSTANEENGNQFQVFVKQEEDSLDEDNGTTPPHLQTYDDPPDYMEEGTASQRSESGTNFSCPHGKGGTESQQLGIKEESDMIESSSGYTHTDYASEDLHEPVCSIHVQEDVGHRNDMQYVPLHMDERVGGPFPGSDNSSEYSGRASDFPAGFPTDTSQLSPGKKRRKRSSVFNEIRLRDRGSHWPEFVEKRGRCVCCALSQIQSRPHSRCGLCKVYLCINEKKNCFYRYHYA